MSSRPVTQHYDSGSSSVPFSRYNQGPYEPCWIVEHHSAPAWVWDETLNPKRAGKRFRITRIPNNEDETMREETVHERNLRAAVMTLCEGDVYAVLVQPKE